MTKVVLALVTLLAISPSLLAQSKFDGAWQTEMPGPRGPDINTIELKTNGSKVTGGIRRPQAGPAATPLEGEVDKELVTFVVRSGEKIITFYGTLVGDHIDFRREARGVAGAGDGPGTGLFGMNGPRTFVATRVNPPIAIVPSGDDYGTWATPAPGAIVIDLKTDGAKLTGTIRKIDPCCSAIVTFEGLVAKDLLMIRIPNGTQAVSYIGRIDGDTLALTRDGAASGSALNNIFGAGGPPANLTAKRVR